MYRVDAEASGGHDDEHDRAEGERDPTCRYRKPGPGWRCALAVLLEGAMFASLLKLLLIARTRLESRASLEAENLTSRQQVIVLVLRL